MMAPPCRVVSTSSRDCRAGGAPFTAAARRIAASLHYGFFGRVEVA
jgi:hypothetical protein